VIKDSFKSIFKDRNLRVSQPRRLVYQTLAQAEEALTPQEIYQSLLRDRRKIGLTSIYRCLDLFETLEMVFKMAEGPAVRYTLCELEYHHHHIICSRCGEVAEVDFCDLSRWDRKVSESTGYEVTGHELRFYGLCRACNQKSKKETGNGVME
jgi:Fur family ferric uptake transcriptional regulator